MFCEDHSASNTYLEPRKEAVAIVPVKDNDGVNKWNEGKPGGQNQDTD